jgi:hypothetical protein
MEIKNRQKVLAITAAVVVGLVVANSVIYEPLKASWLDRADRIKHLKDSVEVDNRLLRRKTEILARWDHMQKTALPGNPSLAGSAILKAKDEWVRQSGVSPDDFSPQLKTDTSADSADAITSWECRTDASGNMRSLLNFLWAVESYPMGLQLEDVEISAKDNEGQELALGLTLSALVLDNGQPPSQLP